MPNDRPGIMGWLLGNAEILGDYEKRVRAFLKWREVAGSEIYGINLLFKPQVVVFDIDLIQFMAKEKFFHKTSDVHIVLQDIAPGLLLQEDQEHKTARDLFMPIFSLSNLQQMFPVFVSKSNKLAAKLKTPNLDLMNNIQSCTLDIISSVAFNYDMNALESESEISKAFDVLLTKNNFDNPSFLATLMFPFLQHVPFPSNIKAKRHLRIVHDCVDKVIQKRISDPKDSSDLLSKILASIKGQKNPVINDLRQHVLTFMTAGHETTASALAWALYALSCDLDIQNKLRSTLTFNGNPSWDDIQNNKYLDKVVKETLRLYTPVAAIARQTMFPFTFKGVYYPKYTQFFVPIQDFQVDADYKDPMVFNPDREEISQLNVPFWLGNRACIGMQLALVEFKTMLAILVKNAEFTIKDKKVVRMNKTTQRPEPFKVDYKLI